MVKTETCVRFCDSLGLGDTRVESWLCEGALFGNRTGGDTLASVILFVCEVRMMLCDEVTGVYDSSTGVKLCRNYSDALTYAMDAVDVVDITERLSMMIGVVVGVETCAVEAV